MLAHHNKNIVFLLIIATFLTTVTFVHPSQTNDDNLTATLSSCLLRFRVLANSDSAKDQADKELLCTKLIPLLSSSLSKVESKEEAASLLEESLIFLNAYCNYVLPECSNISCTIGSFLFPYKTYGSLRFPAGSYDTLLITIGNGLGSNWWCLAFPPLCFVDESFIDVCDSSDEMLRELLGDDTYDDICIEKKEKTGITFGLFSLIKSIFS